MATISSEIKMNGVEMEWINLPKTSSVGFRVLIHCKVVNIFCGNEFLSHRKEE